MLRRRRLFLGRLTVKGYCQRLLLDAYRFDFLCSPASPALRLNCLRAQSIGLRRGLWEELYCPASRLGYARTSSLRCSHDRNSTHLRSRVTFNCPALACASHPHALFRPESRCPGLVAGLPAVLLAVGITSKQGRLVGLAKPRNQKNVSNQRDFPIVGENYFPIFYKSLAVNPPAIAMPNPKESVNVLPLVGQPKPCQKGKA